MKTLLLNCRLTQYCNADCDYCSSFRGLEKISFLRPNEFSEHLKFLYDKYTADLIEPPDLVYLQYTGGEVSLIPIEILHDLVCTARDYFAQKGISVVDGAQSNLIGNSEKFEQIYDLFDGRIGTSVDSFTSHRKISGSSIRYDELFRLNDERIAARHHRLPAVVVVDDDTSDNIVEEIKIANRLNRTITLRAIYSSGKSDHSCSVERLNNALKEGFDAWFLKTRNIVEPYYSFVHKLLNRINEGVQSDGCHNCFDCANKSVLLEPNGDIYQCIEMADLGAYKLGNASEGIFYRDNWSHLNSRRYSLPKDCQGCKYLDVCQGGCMADSYRNGEDIYGKSDKCDAWYYIFTTINERLQEDRASLMRWMRIIDPGYDTYSTEAV